MWWFRAAAGLLLAAALAGCAGYRWVPAGEVGIGEPGETRLAVPVLANETLEPFLAEQVTTLVRRRLLATGTRVVTSGTPMLKGRLVGFSDTVLAFDAQGQASHRRLVLEVRAVLDDGKTQRPEQALRGAAEYRVSGDPAADRNAKDRAIEAAAMNLADQILMELRMIGAPADGH